MSARHARIAAVIGEIGREQGATAAQVCLAWVLGRRKTGWNIVTILGARSEAQLDQASEFRLGFPRSFLEDDEVIELIFGRTRALLDT